MGVECLKIIYATIKYWWGCRNYLLRKNKQKNRKHSFPNS